jgi:transglutaminase-like putative cysteine protease
MREFLSAARFVESEHPAIVARVRELDLLRLPLRERAARLFDHVRNDVRYEFMAKFTPDDYLASRILEANQGFCVQKAVLLAALGRAAEIPTAIVLCDMRDHALPEKVIRAIGTNVMYHHGLNAFHIDGAWLTVDASLDPKFLDKKRYPHTAFHGTADALLAATTTDGARAAEYVTFHGRYADLPFEQTTAAFTAGYMEADLSALVAMGLRVG